MAHGPGRMGTYLLPSIWMRVLFMDVGLFFRVFIHSTRTVSFGYLYIFFEIYTYYIKREVCLLFHISKQYFSQIIIS
jgi:hypothetical protein